MPQENQQYYWAVSVITDSGNVEVNLAKCDRVSAAMALVGALLTEEVSGVTELAIRRGIELKPMSL